MSTTVHRQQLAEKLGKGESPAMRQILEMAMTEEEAGFILDLPAAPADLAPKYGLTAAAIQERIQGLTARGLLIPAPEGMRFPPYWFTLHDTILSSRPEYMPAGIDGLWRELLDNEGGVEELGHMQATLFPTPLIRTVPVLGSVSAGTMLLPQESIAEIILAHRDLISIRDCCCRVGAKKCDHPTQVCMQFMGRAEFDVYRNAGKRVSAEQAIAIAVKAGNSGLVPTVPNLSRMEDIDFICFCCGCCCLVLEPGLACNSLSKILNPSRFVASIHQCDGCGDCVKQCAVNAITVPQDASVAVVDRNKCLGCGACVPACPMDLPITMDLIRPAEYIPETGLSTTAFMHAAQ